MDSFVRSFRNSRENIYQKEIAQANKEFASRTPQSLKKALDYDSILNKLKSLNL